MSQQQQKESESEKGGMGVLELVIGRKKQSQKQQGKQSGFSSAQLKQKSFKSLSEQQQLAIVNQLAIQEYKSISGKKTNAGFKAYFKRNMKSLIAKANAEFMSGKLGMEVDEGMKRQQDSLRQNKLDIQQMETYSKQMSEAKEKLDRKLVDFAEAADKYAAQTQKVNMHRESLLATMTGNTIQEAANLQRQEANRISQVANLLTRTGQVQSVMQHTQNQQNFLIQQKGDFTRHDEMQAANVAQNKAIATQMQKDRESREAIARQEALQREELQKKYTESQEQLAALQREQTATQGQASRQQAAADAQASRQQAAADAQAIRGAIGQEGQATRQQAAVDAQAIKGAIGQEGQATRATLEAGFKGLSAEMAKLATQFSNMNADFKAQIDALIQQGKDNTDAMQTAINAAIIEEKKRDDKAREIIAKMSRPCSSGFNWIYACHIYGTDFPPIDSRAQLIFVCAGGSGCHWFNGDPNFRGTDADRTWNALGELGAYSNDGENGAGESSPRPAWAKTTSGNIPIPDTLPEWNGFSQLLLPNQKLRTKYGERGEIVGPPMNDCYTTS